MSDIRTHAVRYAEVFVAPCKGPLGNMIFKIIRIWLKKDIQFRDVYEIVTGKIMS